MPPGRVETVLGAVVPSDLGVTLPHEHLLIRISDGWYFPPRNKEEDRFSDSPMSLEVLHQVYRRPWSHKDNCRVEDLAVVIREVRKFVEAGGGAIVDVTPQDLGRNPVGMREVSQKTGIKVIAGCGYYVDASHPAELASMSSESVSELLEVELCDGIADTGIRAGVIGEIGTGNPVTPSERKVLRAAALAHRRTGAPISVHLFPAGGTGHHVLDTLEEAGADLNKVALGHLDGQDPIQSEEHIELAGRGAYVEYDMFGSNWASDDLREHYSSLLYWSPPPSDQQRVRALAALFSAGLGDHVLISQDVCSKIQQIAWGGPGYGHIVRYMVPFFKANGFLDEQLDSMLRRNPQRWLTWRNPHS